MPEILTRGNPLLEQPSAPVRWPDADFESELAALHAELAAFRRRHGFGVL